MSGIIKCLVCEKIYKTEKTLNRHNMKYVGECAKVVKPKKITMREEIKELKIMIEKLTKIVLSQQPINTLHLEEAICIRQEETVIVNEDTYEVIDDKELTEEEEFFKGSCEDTLTYEMEMELLAEEDEEEYIFQPIEYQTEEESDDDDEEEEELSINYFTKTTQELMESVLCSDSDDDDEKEESVLCSDSDDEDNEKVERLIPLNFNISQELIDSVLCSDSDEDDNGEIVKQYLKREEERIFNVKIKRDKMKGDDKGIPTSFKIYFLVDFKDKQKFKNKCGGLWDARQKMWYIEYDLINYNLKFNNISENDIYEMLDSNKNIYDYNLSLFFKEFIQWNGTNKDVDKILELNKIIKDYHKSNLK